MKFRVKFFIGIALVFIMVFLSWHYFIEKALLHNESSYNLSLSVSKNLQKYFNKRIPELRGGDESTNRGLEHSEVSISDIGQAAKSKAVEAKQHLFYAGYPDAKSVALTFDDGPDIFYTTKILDMLKSNNIKATFFIVGTRAQMHPEMIKRIVDEGHIIGNHTWDHPEISKLSNDKVKDEVRKTDNILYSITGHRTALFRPPYGAADTSVIGEIVGMGYNIIDWSVDTRDWAGTPPNKIMEYVRSEMRPGGIILQHCAGGKGENLLNTVTALQNIINLLKSEGYNFVEIPELLNIPAYR